MKKTRIRLSLFSLVLALVLFGLTICATGREPFSVYWSILAGSFGSTKSFLNVLAYTLPLIMTGLGAAVAFQSGVFNIGGEGQVLVGGLAAVIVGLTVPLPAPWGWLLALLAGFAAGALWAVLPTLFAGRNLTSLSVATIMMNSIAALLTEYIVKSFFQRPGASNTETVVVNEGSILPRFFPSTQFNYGIFVALFCVAAVTWMLYKTPFGFSLRAMGQNPRAMQQAGLPIYRRTLAAMCISGGLFALGGRHPVSGGVQALCHGLLTGIRLGRHHRGHTGHEFPRRRAAVRVPLRYAALRLHQHEPHQPGHHGDDLRAAGLHRHAGGLAGRVERAGPLVPAHRHPTETGRSC